MFDQNLEAAMLYVRFCRDNLKPTPSTSPVPEPTADLLAAYDQFPSLNAQKPFSPKVLQHHLDQIISVFGKHMTEELDTLTKDKIAQVGEKEYATIDGQLRDKLKAYGPDWFLCIAIGKHYPTSMLSYLDGVSLFDDGLSIDANDDLHSAATAAAHSPQGARPCKPMPQFSNLSRAKPVQLWWGPKFAAWWKYCPYPENLKFF